MLDLYDIMYLLVAGMIGLIWFDIRKIRKERPQDMVEKEKEHTWVITEMHAMREGLFDVFITKDKHSDLCENAGLKLREHISKEMRASEKKILDAIRQNGHG